ncbi:MAG: hypothetical protein B6244_03290 [Candidatus Cloacimonetes bacterium 4572_55]|nr:MAG: hypothetical protein B6244_03290 [Candidatus Cloacimonetes bacterium 4572_55]
MYEKLEKLIYEGFQRMQESIEKSKEEHDREMSDMRKEQKLRAEEHDREVQRVEKKLDKRIAEITDSLGRFAENMVAPALVRLLNEQGIQITEYAQRVRSDIRKIEYDLIAINSEYLVVTSVKMTLNSEDAKYFFKERLPIFKDVFPRYKDKKVIGALAGMSIVQEAGKYAMKRGLYVLTQSGDNVKALTHEDVDLKGKFSPRIF